MQKQKFYIIAHNPNTLREAENFMKAGANALEPDICFDENKPGQFFVSHGTFGSNPFTPENSLVTYLTGLRKLITDPQNNFNLALIAFDIKTPSFDINKFINVVFDNFFQLSHLQWGGSINYRRFLVEHRLPECLRPDKRKRGNWH